MRVERGCLGPPKQRLKEGRNKYSVIEWNRNTLKVEAEKRDLLADEELAGWLYDYCKVGWVTEYLGDYWYNCPKSLVEYNSGPALIVANTALEWASWIKHQAPNLAFDGKEPTIKMERLVKLVLTVMNRKEVEDLKAQNKKQSK